MNEKSQVAGRATWFAWECGRMVCRDGEDGELDARERFIDEFAFDEMMREEREGKYVSGLDEDGMDEEFDLHI